MRRSILLVLLALPLMSCGKGNFFADTSPETPTTDVPPLKGYTLLHAYGDSITEGVGVPSQGFVYVSLSAAYNSLPLTDRARSGDQGCDVAAQQIFPNNESPSLATHGLYSMLIGATDLGMDGIGTPETVYNVCHQAAISWLATPVEYKVLATSAAVTATGASHLETANGWNALTTDLQGSTITFSFQRSTVAPLYLWYRITDGNGNAFTCALDGNPLASLSAQLPTLLHTYNGTSSTLAVFRAPAIAAGNHKLVCTQTTAGLQGMGLVALGGPPPAGTPNMPRLLVGLLSLLLNGLHSDFVAAYDADIRANAAIFSGDGLDVELFNAAQYMTGTTADLADIGHPNVLGQQEIFLGFEQALK